MKKRTATWALGSLLAASGLAAQERGFDGIYAVGHLKLDSTGADVSADAVSAKSTSSDRDVGARIGYRKTLASSRFLVGVEAGLDTGDTLEGRTLILGDRGVNFSFEKRGVTTVLDGVVGFRLRNGLLAFGSLGYATSEFSRGAFAFDVRQPPPPEIVTDDRIHAVTIGFGVEARAAERLHVRIAVTKEASQEFDAGDFGLSTSQFGATTAKIVHSAAQVKLGVVFQF